MLQWLTLDEAKAVGQIGAQTAIIAIAGWFVYVTTTAVTIDPATVAYQETVKDGLAELRRDFEIHLARDEDNQAAILVLMMRLCLNTAGSDAAREGCFGVSGAAVSGPGRND